MKRSLKPTWHLAITWAIYRRNTVLRMSMTMPLLAGHVPTRTQYVYLKVKFKVKFCISPGISSSSRPFSRSWNQLTKNTARTHKMQWMVSHVFGSWVTSKYLGIGPYERSWGWGDVKTIKTAKDLTCRVMLLRRDPYSTVQLWLMRQELRGNIKRT